MSKGVKEEIDINFRRGFGMERKEDTFNNAGDRR